MEITLTRGQKKFCDAGAFEVLYGGAAGGGKSYGQLIDIMLYALRYPGSRQIIFRRTYPELEKSLIRASYELYPRELYSYVKTSRTGRFKGGSTIDFAYCDSEEDVYKYQSAEYDVIRFDELTHFTESMYVYLISRCRGANGYPKHIKSSTNPGGIGHSWVKSRFIEPAPAGREFSAGHMSRIFIPARVTDNKFLMSADPDYVKRLESLSDRDRRALLYGDWDLEGGRFFDGFEQDVHVIPSYNPQGNVSYYIAMDYGLDMLAAYKIAVDERRRAVVVAELYEGKDSGGEGLIVSEAAERLSSLIGSDEIKAVFAPPDLWSRQKDSGKSIARLFFENGISLTKVSSARVHGWLELKEWLRVYEDECGKRSAALTICGCCENLIRTMSLLQCDSANPSDCAKTPHELTHAPDALRYFVAGAPRAAVKTALPPRFGFEFEKKKRTFSERTDRIKII